MQTNQIRDSIQNDFPKATADDYFCTEEPEESALLEIVGESPRHDDAMRHFVEGAALKMKGICRESTACRVIARAVAHCGAHLSNLEIKRAVRSAWNGEIPRLWRDPKWPALDLEKVHGIAKEGPSIADLQQRSILTVDSLTTQLVVKEVFPGDPCDVLICIAKQQNQAITRPVKSFFNVLHQFPYIVPNPMRGSCGRNLEGQWSSRCNDNVDHRRFLAVRIDLPPWQYLSCESKGVFGTAREYEAKKQDAAAAILSYLRRDDARFPLVLVVHSDGAPLEGWYLVENVPESEVRKFFHRAVSLGAAVDTWAPWAFSRMPGGLRNNGKRQRILFFDPRSLREALQRGGS
jgi:hypothetical protein